MHQRRICVITSGRADYDLLTGPMRAIRAHPALRLQLLVTGAHLDPRFGDTLDRIIDDGFAIDARAPLGDHGDGPLGAARASAAATVGVAEALLELKPDVVLILGDRFEILACAQAATLCGVPIAHIGGGDLTEGAFDEGLRHAITKLSHVHLTTHEAAARRVRQMGEAPERVHVVGNPGLDRFVDRVAPSRETLESALGAPLGARNLLVGFHPVTLAADGGMSEFSALLEALGAQSSDITIWMTRPNADPGHMAIREKMDAWAAGRRNVRVRDVLGAAFPDLLAAADAIVGNSSAGLTEAPSLGTPTVNVGRRQAGRTAGPTVVHAEGEVDAIRAALARALALDGSNADNPYGDGRSSPRIAAVLAALPERAVLLAKTFHDLEPVR